MAEYIYQNATGSGNRHYPELEASADNRGPLILDTTAASWSVRWRPSFFSTANAAAPGIVCKGASTWAPGASKVCLNGGTIATSAALTAGYPASGTQDIFQNGVSNESVTGYIRRLSYWPRVLSDTEMQQVTT